MTGTEAVESCMASPRNRLYLWILVVIPVVALCMVFPPVRLVPRHHVQARVAATVFDARVFVAEFWTNQLLPACVRATDLRVLLAALQTNPVTAGRQLGRCFGVSRQWYFFVRGVGRVLCVGPDAVALGVDEDPEPDVLIELGPVFGNTVRDATGLLDVNRFPNSQDFNQISAELNRKIETEVLPLVQAGAQPGRIVRFCGCAEVDPESGKLLPLRVIPVEVSIE